MRVLVKEGDAVLADLTFEDEEVYIGSEAGCAIQLPDTRVSTRTAVIAPIGQGAWHIENLDSDSSIKLNARTLAEQAPLNDGDQIALHDYVLQVFLDAGFDQSVAEVEEDRLGAEELAKIRKFPLPAGSIVKRHFDGITMVKNQLDRAADLGVDVSHCRDIHELIDQSLGILVEAFDARAAWIGIRRQPTGELEVVGGRHRSGQSCGTNPIILLLEYRCCERNQHICVRKVRDQKDIGSAMAVPLSTQNGTYGMLYIDRPLRTKRFQIPDLDMLTAFGSTVAAKLAVILEGRLQREVAVTATEVSVVHAIQAKLDPKSTPDWGNLQLSAYGRSGQETPGDVYDIMQRPDSEITAFLLGHIRAKGASLALSMARLHSTFRVAMLHNDPPHAFARELNWLMHNEKDPALVDAICVLVDAKTGKLQHCRAGKIGAFVVDPNGKPRKLPAADGPSIGAVKHYEYLSKLDTLAPGETLALYSRGVATATNAEGDKFSEASFIELICDGYDQPPAMMINEVSQELNTFIRDGKHPDDITLMLLRRTKE